MKSFIFELKFKLGEIVKFEEKLNKSLGRFFLKIFTFRNSFKKIFSSYKISFRLSSDFRCKKIAFSFM